MKRTSAAASAALLLTAALAGCTSPGSQARDIAEQWLEGDSSAQCINSPSTWGSWQLGAAKHQGTVDGTERWHVDISGTRSLAPIADGWIVVDLGPGGEGCVRWADWSR